MSNKEKPVITGRNQYSTINEQMGLAVDKQTGQMVNLEEDNVPIIEKPGMPLVFRSLFGTD